MNRRKGSDEVNWLRLISETSNRDYWNHSIPERIGFQQFGTELHEEDFEKDGIQYRDFCIRDRNSLRKAISGFSKMNNNDQEFQVTLDVRPFKLDELMVAIVEDKYVVIEGEHAEKCEDNSVCTRKFTRRYILPRGCATDTLKCVYVKGNLSISLDKKETEDEPAFARIAPITMDSWIKTRSEPVEVEKEHKKSQLLAEAIKKLNIATTEPLKEVPNTNEMKSNNEKAIVRRRCIESLEKSFLS